ncbi:MAG: rhomboid family protein [Verrucomicrobiota bacterium]
MTTPSLTSQRCLHHSQREAVARCPECHQFFCRECITEHDDRVICAACLRKLVKAETSRKHWLRYVTRAAQLGGGVLLCWVMFYGLGRILISIPADFHEGTVWETTDWERE